MQENHSAIQTGTPNKLADFPIRTLILSMGMPMVLSMVLQAVYNIVDTVFVSHMKNGATAVLALTDSYSIQLLIVAVGVGTGIGRPAFQDTGRAKFGKGGLYCRKRNFSGDLHLCRFSAVRHFRHEAVYRHAGKRECSPAGNG